MFMYMYSVVSSTLCTQIYHIVPSPFRLPLPSLSPPSHPFLHIAVYVTLLL
jgi:hypothetical protein